MQEIKQLKDINRAFREFDVQATEALNQGKKYYLVHGDQKPDLSMTAKQRGALHVWCDQFAKALNEAGHLRKVVRINGEIAEVDWTMMAFKEDVYKVMLNALTSKTSTEQQNRIDSSDVANHVNRHMGQTYGVTVPWPSRRG